MGIASFSSSSSLLKYPLFQNSGGARLPNADSYRATRVSAQGGQGSARLQATSPHKGPEAAQAPFLPRPKNGVTTGLPGKAAIDKEVGGRPRSGIVPSRAHGLQDVLR